MKRLFLFFLFEVCIVYCFAQKPVIDSSVYDKWPSVGSAAISNDGNYVLYTIENQPVGSQTLVLQVTRGSWKMEIQSGVDGLLTGITSDSKRAVFIKPEDSLGIVTLGRSSIEYIPHVASFKLPKNGRGKWLAYQLKSPGKELVLRNVVTGNQKLFADVTAYLFSNDGRVLVLQTESKKDNAIRESLKWINLDNGNMTTIWEGTKADNIVFDENSKQLVFTVEDTINSLTETSFWYYKAGTDKAILLADNQTFGIDNGLRLDNVQGFSKDGSRLFIRLKEKDRPKPNPDAVRVDVWSYTDEKLQSQQLKETDLSYSYSAVIPIPDHRIIQLEQDNEPWQFSFDKGRMSNLALFCHREGDAGLGEDNWNRAARKTWYLVSTKDGTRKRIKAPDGVALNNFELSPEEKYVIFYDSYKRDFFSYEIASGITRNITKSIAVTWTGYVLNDLPLSSHFPRGVAGWVREDAAVLLYDQHDIWQVDPAGNQHPINLTNGYGDQHNIVFYLRLEEYSNKSITNNQQLILSAFNRSTKDNGFYSKVLGEKGDPKLLTMGPYIYDIVSDAYVPDGCNFRPMKAMNATTYLVRRMSAIESPNYFSTTDFKTFTRLSDLHSEKEYNWLTAELINWKISDSSLSQGILYKPENFDPGKKYPVIFHYYDRKSDGLNSYLKPGALANGCAINIPSFVSNGYLVFTPDIYFKTGEPGESALNAVVSAANYLSQMPWVDSMKMGIQGCSFGGVLTNYLVTHARLFRAACSSSGIADFISGYGSLAENGASLQGMYELGQNRIGAALWQRPDLYIKNSPIFNADQVTTPFLMMHTKNDGVCPFANAVELFTALRRLGKRVWMLQYDDCNHGLWGKPAGDFSIRIAQFFDHYLKDMPAPKWMVQGIPAKMKGSETGLEQDTSGKEP